MIVSIDSRVTELRKYNVRPRQNSVSGLSSGAFMAVQLHLAYSSKFAGAGIIAGGPYRSVEAFQAPSTLAEDAFLQNAISICMNPMIPQTGPNPKRLARLARETANAGEIDALENLADDAVYIFTGSKDLVVRSGVVLRTKEFYELLGVPRERIAYRDDVLAGHAIITDNPEDSLLGANHPPYINCGGFMQSHDILRHIHGPLKPPAERLGGQLLRFEQAEFFGGQTRASMSKYGYAYVPRAVEEGAPARVHVVLHGCKQGYNYIRYVNGRPDIRNYPPYGNRYITTTGYNHIADSNDFIVLYPQVEGLDDGDTQNPDGCWDWWGYSSPDPTRPDYYSRKAIQIEAIHGMLCALGG